MGYQKAATEKAITQAMQESGDKKAATRKRRQESGDQITIDAILRRSLRLLSKG